MRVKLIVLILIIFTIAAISTIRISSKGKQEVIQELQKSQDRGTINWHVKAAKAKGEDQVFLSGPRVEYADGVKDVDEALLHLGLVTAKPIEKKSYVRDTDEIVTWYRFKIVEKLSHNSLPKCEACGISEEEIPVDLLPLKRNEILVVKYGGTVNLEGVKVTMIDPQIPEFVMFQSYLLFLATDSSGKIGQIRMGPTGIFSVMSDGSIEPITKKEHPLKKDIKTRYSDSLEQVKKSLRSRLLSQ